MLAVIGLEVSFSGVADIDVFDYHLYCNKPIALTPLNTKRLFANALALIEKLLLNNHLDKSKVDLLLLNDTQENLLLGTLFAEFASVNSVKHLSDALNSAQALSKNKHSAVVILTLNSLLEDALMALLVCDPQVRINNESGLKRCFVYAEIMASSAHPLLETDKRAEVSQYIVNFLHSQQITSAQVESILLAQESHKSYPLLHQRSWLNAFHELSNTGNCAQKTTLLSAVDIIQTSKAYFNEMLSLVAAVLCLDQRYRLGMQQGLLIGQQSDAADETSAFYCLAKSTSYLSSEASPRHIVHSFIGADAQHLVLLRSAQQPPCKDTPFVPKTNGFLVQQALKPVIFSAPDIERLLETLQQALLISETLDKQQFNAYCKQQYLAFRKERQQDNYHIVLLATSVSTLKQQINLALQGVANAVLVQQAWKTPAGSYFSGRLIKAAHCQPALSFLYPGIGAMYVGMGNDLLRLFPQGYDDLQHVNLDLASNLQDALITPRLLSPPDFLMSQALDKKLRSNLANIAEAGVSYACLLSTIFQQHLNLKASSAAGYSMGEVSMFTALQCWENPQKMSQRLRDSQIFTTQLSGPLQRLDDAWGPATSTNHAWESYHIKATVMQVESLIGEYPRVFITIINTPESLVIAGDPKQCLALCQQLGVRALALNVANIIHCDLARSEYENMQQLYSLSTKPRIDCQLFSSSCYLPIPFSEKAIAVSISKCLTEQVDFPRLIKKMAAHGESVFLEMGAGKCLSTWVERILKDDPDSFSNTLIGLSVNQKKSDDYSAILKTLAVLISLGYPVNLQSFFSGSLIQPVKKISASVLAS